MTAYVLTVSVCVSAPMRERKRDRQTETDRETSTGIGAAKVNLLFYAQLPLIQNGGHPIQCKVSRVNKLQQEPEITNE